MSHTGFKLKHSDLSVWVTQNVVDAIKSLGANVISIPTWFTRWKQRDWTIDAAYVEMIDRVVSYCKNAGIDYLIIVRVCWGDSASASKGWLWNWTEFIDNPLYQEQWLSLLEYLHKRYITNDAANRCIGIHSPNYPFHRHNPTTEQINYYETVLTSQYVALMRSLDARRPIIYAPVHKGQGKFRGYDEIPAPLDSNMIYMLDGWLCNEGFSHNDWKVHFCSGGREYTGDKTEFWSGSGGKLTHLKNFCDKYGVTAWIDEFHIERPCRESDEKLGYLANLIEAYHEAHAIHWTWQSFGQNQHASIVTNAKDLDSPKTLEVLQRYFGKEPITAGGDISFLLVCFVILALLFLIFSMNTKRGE